MNSRMRIDPPKSFIRFLQWFCPPDLLESIEGDLFQKYWSDMDLQGPRRAKWFFILNVLRFFRWDIVSRNHFNIMRFNSGLLINHTKIAFRNYRQYLSYTSINLAGLAVGLAVCFVIYSYTRQQLSYDLFHQDIDRLYRVNQTNIWSPEGGFTGSTAPPLASEILEKIPGITNSTRINTPGSYEVRYESLNRGLLVYREKKVLAADPNFFNFFNIPLIAGDPESALNGKNQVVITSEISEKYFGSEDAVGKVLTLGDEQQVMVTGVVRELPRNMHFQFDFLLSMATNPNLKTFDWSWIWTQVVTYVKIAEGNAVDGLDEKMTTLFNPQIKATFDRVGMDFDQFMEDKGRWRFQLQAVKDIHLYSTDIGNRLGSVGDIKIVRILQVMAGLILIIAIINFVNLSTARANIRGKEIGVKKTMGATRYELAQQFQTESILMTIFAAVLSIPVICGLTMMIENQIGIEISYAYMEQFDSIFYMFLMLLMIGLLAGIYPSLYMTGLRTVSVINKQSSNHRGNLGLRNVLVTIQFAISLALLSGGLLISRQLQFLTNKDLGFDRENILVLRSAEKLGDQLHSFRDEVANLPDVVNASVAMDMPGRLYYEDLFMREGSDIKLAISQIKIDPYFFPTLNLKVRTGRAYQENNPADRHHVLINETTASLFGWTPEEALNKKIIYNEVKPDPVIIGVVNDFHFQSLYENIRPLIFFHVDAPIWGDQRVVAVKFQEHRTGQVINQLETAWNRFGDQSPFEYTILDEELNQLYVQDQQLSSLVNLLSYLSVFIAVLGLIGLVAFTVDQRRKEIGIRKVLGATSGSIFIMVNRQFFRLFILGLIVSIPFTWSVIDDWLKDFAFHIDIPWHTFAMAGGILMALCLLAVGLLIYRVLQENPIQAIREE